MEARCFRKGGNFSQDVAHMDDAIDQLQQHYRAVHPTKAFYRNRELESLEQYNQTAEELMEQDNLAAPEAEPQYDWVHLRSMVRRWRELEQQGRVYYNEATLSEVERRVEEHFANQPAEQAQEAAIPVPRLYRPVNVGAGLPLVDPAFDEADVLEEADPDGF